MTTVTDMKIWLHLRGYESLHYCSPCGITLAGTVDKYKYFTIVPLVRCPICGNATDSAQTKFIADDERGREWLKRFEKALEDRRIE